MPPSAEEIVDLTGARRTAFSAATAAWNEASLAYRGRYHELSPGEFRSGEVPKIANFIKRSWDLFARSTGKVPDVRVAPLSLAEQERADRQEKICLGYNRVWDMKRRMRVMAHYLVGFGALGAGIMPDRSSGFPMLLVEDPRNVLPGSAWQSTSGVLFGGLGDTIPADLGGTLEDCIVQKTLSGRQIRRLWPEAPVGSYLGDTARELARPHPVLMYYDEEMVRPVLEEPRIGLAPATRHGAPWCPWVFPTLFTPDSPAGEGMFRQQIGLEIAFMRLIDQKLGLNDAVVWPWMFQKGWIETYPEKRLMVGGSPDADVKLLSPSAQFPVYQDFGFLRDLLRVLSFETEATQGQVTGGPITGRGLVELSRATVETVQSFFDEFSFYLPKLYATAMLVDREVFGDREKILAGRGRGETFHESYRPRDAIGDRIGAVSVEFGPGLGGFEGHLQLLQDLGAEAVSIETVMENAPWIRSVSDEKRKIMRGKLEKLLFDQALLGQAAVTPAWIADFLDAIEKGEDWRVWLRENPPQQATALPEEIPPVPPEAALPPEAASAPPLAALLGIG